MSAEDLDEFIQRRQEDYEASMVAHYDDATSIEQLKGFHITVKAEITRFIAAKWQEEMSDPMPNNLKNILPKKIDEIFEILKVHFCSKLGIEVPPENDNPWKSRAKPFIQTSNPNPYTSKRASRSERNNKNNDNGDIAIGIDLGTTMCCVAVLNNGRIEVVENRSQKNSKTTPSYIAFQDDGSDSFGQVAKDQAYRFPERTIYDAKRMIGRSWNDSQLQNDKKVWPFEVIEENGNPKVKIGKRTRYPHEISARLLSRFRAMAEDFLHVKRGTIKKAVITVPAYFSEPQRRATNEAARCAGLEVLNILSEPTAAAIAYDWEKRLDGTRNALIYDLGGGTFDVSISIVKPDNVNILCVHGDTHLGGQDFDQLLMEYCIKEFQRENGIDLLVGRDSEDKRVRDGVLRALARLRQQCERVKEWLSSTDSAMVEVPSIVENNDLVVQVTKDTLDELCRPLVKKTLSIIKKALKDARGHGIKGRQDIDDIILVGGSTRMPLVIGMVKEYFGGKDLCIHINPDEAVAYGAAIQADQLRRPNKNKGERILPEVQDVTPLTLGIECLGDIFSKVIPRNSKIPCDHHEIYSTSDDDQTSLRFTICQGESEKASDNIVLGEFYFGGIPPKRATEEKVQVTMTIDSMGILQVKAVSLTSGMENAISISSDQLGMSDKEIEELSRELESLMH